MTSYLARPSIVFGQSYLDALREGHVAGTGPALTSIQISKVGANLQEHLDRLDRDGQSGPEVQGRRLAGAPSNMFWLIDQGEFIGEVSIRARIDTEVLAHFGGHIGYGVRPARRGRGYGSRMLHLALGVARGMGLGIVRISCAEDNHASRKVIEANGGIFLRRSEPAWYAGQPFLLFEIYLV